jgi:hypothetical protein
MHFIDCCNYAVTVQPSQPVYAPRMARHARFHSYFLKLSHDGVNNITVIVYRMNKE